jgi:hypothetical protein
MRLSDIQLEAKKKPKQVKAKSKKPKIVKPNKGGSSKHPYQGSLVGEDLNRRQAIKGLRDALGDFLDFAKGQGMISIDDVRTNFDPLALKFYNLTGVNFTEGKKPELPKQNNPVAKHSRNMPGAGAHKSAKDYDRKNKRKDINKQLDEAPLVMPYSAASDTALGHTAKWLQSHYSRKNDRRAEAYKKLGKLVGFEVQERGEDSIMFKRFFTQTENIKKIK